MHLHVFLATLGAVLSTLVLPLPEEVTLLGAGYLAKVGQLGLWEAFVAGYLGVMGGDAATFFAARAFLPRLLHTRIARWLIKPDQQRWAEDLVGRHGTAASIIARFLVGLRGPVYMALGASDYGTGEFLLVNAIAGIVEVGAMVAVGYWLGPSDKVVHGTREVELGVGAILLFSFLLPFGVRWLLGRKRGRAHA